MIIAPTRRLKKPVQLDLGTWPFFFSFLFFLLLIFPFLALALAQSTNFVNLCTYSIYGGVFLCAISISTVGNETTTLTGKARQGKAGP
ncbi:hypothetical protein V8E52_010159 [Russula decolorans]|jgi:hypothetical protein